MDIYIIRHGQSTGNLSEVIMGWSEHPLTDLGRTQAAAVAERLAALGPMPVVCSDLLRARQTAECIAERWGGTVEPDARWREMCSGDYEGRNWAEIEQDPALAAAYDADPMGTSMPGGECVNDLLARVREGFAALQTRTDARIALVAHGGPIRALLAHVLELPPHRFWALETDHAGISCLRVTDGWVSVRMVNETSHLGKVLSSKC